MSPGPGEQPVPLTGAGAPGAATGVAGRPRFAERLVPGVGGWAAMALFAVVLGAGLAPVSSAVGIGVGVGTLVLGTVLLWVGSPRVLVSGDELVAGRARIPLVHLGPAVVLDRAALSEQMGPAWDARAYACLRSWTGGAVRVDVVDPRDPTPYWIVSSRRPQELAAALDRRA